MKYAEIENNGLTPAAGAEIKPIKPEVQEVSEFDAGQKAMREALDKIQKIDDQEKLEKMSEIPGEEKPEKKPDNDVLLESDLEFNPEPKNQPEVQSEVEKQEEEAKKEQTEEQKKEARKKKRYFQTQNKKREQERLVAEREQLLEMTDRLAQENENLKKYADDVNHQSSIQYGEAAYEELKKAISVRKRSIDEGDSDAMVESDILLNEALSKVRKVDEWVNNETQRLESQKQADYQRQMEQQYYDEQQYNQPQQPQVNPNVKVLQSWIVEHPEVNRSSRRYNPAIAEEISKFSLKLDTQLQKTNQMHEAFTPKYFNTLNKHFDKVSNHFAGVKKNRTSNPYVGGVTRSGSASSAANRPSNDTKLTNAELQQAEAAGITPESYLKSKLEIRARKARG